MHPHQLQESRADWLRGFKVALVMRLHICGNVLRDAVAIRLIAGMLLYAMARACLWVTNIETLFGRGCLNDHLTQIVYRHRQQKWFSGERPVNDPERTHEIYFGEHCLQHIFVYIQNQ